MLPVVLTALLAGSASATLIDVIDNGDDGYSTTGGWGTISSKADDFKNDIDYTESADHTATWSFSELDAGTYKVYAIWVPLFSPGNNDQHAKYNISDGGSTAIDVNQNLSPAHDLQITDGSGNLWFEKLGTVTVSDGTLDVTIWNPVATGNYIVADAVAISAPEPATLGLLGIGGFWAVHRRNRVSRN